MRGARQAGGTTTRSIPMSARHWSSNLLFLIIAIGTEAGIANVWKFSYLAGANGGGLFVALYFMALFLIAIPALMAEMMIGRHGGRSVPGTMQVLVTRDGIAPFWKSFGVLATVSMTLILSFYFVVCGWMLDYFVFGLRGGFRGIDAAGAQAAHNAMMSNPLRMLLFSGIIIALTAIIIARGINKGIERVSGVLTPLRFVILIVLMIYSMFFADFGAAARFLFSIDWSKLTRRRGGDAFGQAFFSLGVGVGVLMMMGAYMKREYSITRGVLTVAIAQGLVALIAGMSIFPLVFSYGLEPTQGPGLIFVTLPVAFGQMPYGSIFGTLLFLLLSFAALTATIVHAGADRRGAGGIHQVVTAHCRLCLWSDHLADGHRHGAVVQPMERRASAAVDRHRLERDAVRRDRLPDLEPDDAARRIDGCVDRGLGTVTQCRAR